MPHVWAVVAVIDRRLRIRRLQNSPVERRCCKAFKKEVDVPGDRLNHLALPHYQKLGGADL
jgi:uncharacterized protein YlaI